MTRDFAEVERARNAAERGAWVEAYDLLTARDASDLEAPDLEALADAAWWLCHVEESLAARQQAYAAYVAANDAKRAGYNAWMLSTEYQFVGRPAQSAGWLSKAQRHLRDQPDCEEKGFVTYAEAELAEARGDLDEGLALAVRMTDIGALSGSRDVVAMGLALQARLLIAKGEVPDGVALLDEVMCDVVAGELGELVTGWLYCLAVAMCFDIADVQRAAEWNDAAMTWCASLPASTPFHGLCRVDRVELLSMAGEWLEARAQADQACDELLAYHPNMAGESFYVAGEVRRRMGDLDAAERAFLRAHELGRDPQPGLALLRLTQGQPEAASAALRSCLVGAGWSQLNRARLLAAHVQVAVTTGDHQTARKAAEELTAVSEGSGAMLLEALATTSQGAVALAEGDPPTALDRLRRGRTLWLELGLPYEAAQARMLIAAASRAAGDDDTARLELGAARAVFERLGSSADVRKVAELLSTVDRQPDSPGGLSPREVEVLRLVAAGRTNRDIAAALVISQHTVARHLNNIFAKIGVSSRAAATAFAYTHELV